MPLNNVQTGTLANRLQVVASLFPIVSQSFSVCEDAEAQPLQKQIARHILKYLSGAILVILTEPIDDPSLPPYTAQQVTAIRAGLETFAQCHNRLQRDIAFAQQQLADENGNVVVGHTTEQIEAIESEARRLYARMKALLEALP